MPAGIPIDPEFRCPACGRHEPKVVLFCSRCWWLIPTPDRGALRSMTLEGADTKSKMVKCVRIVRKKLALAERCLICGDPEPCSHDFDAQGKKLDEIARTMGTKLAE